MKQTLEDLLVKYEHPIVINCDNTSSINMSKNPIMHSKTKHIPIKYHFLREKLSQKTVKLEYVDTNEKITDIFTKPLPKEAFEHLKQRLEDFLMKYDNPVVINCDNTSAINISKNHVMHSKTKHIPIKYHFLRDQVSQKVVKLDMWIQSLMYMVYSLSHYPKKHLSILDISWE